MALDQRERLQHRVVDARRDLGALLGADALDALGGELPQPRADDEHERTDDRAGRDKGGRGAVLAEEEDRAGHEEHDPENRQRAAGPERAAAGEHGREPGGDQCGAEDGRDGEAERQ